MNTATPAQGRNNPQVLTNDPFARNLYVKPVEPSPILEISFSTDIKAIQSLIPGYKGKMAERIGKDFNCFVKVKGAKGKGLFAIGFLLVQEVVCQNPLINWEDQQNFLLDCYNQFISYTKLDPSRRGLIEHLRNKLKNLFDKAVLARKEGKVNLNHQAIATEFISEQSKEDKEITSAIAHLGRCLMIFVTSQDSKVSKSQNILGKLTSIDWDVDDIYLEDFFKIFCTSFQFEIGIFLNSDTTTTDKVLGKSNKKAFLFDCTVRSKEFKALLFRMEDRSDNINNSVPLINSKAEPILTRNKDVILNNQTSQSPTKPNNQLPQMSPSHSQNEPAQTFEKCDICRQSILSNLVYINPNCRHVYCCYCVSDVEETHKDLTLCFLKRCDHKMSQTELKKFLKQCRTREKGDVPEERLDSDHPQGIPTSATTKDSAKKMNESIHFGPKRITCHLCEEEINEANPLLFVNDKCGHSICKIWFNRNEPRFNGMCFLGKCTQQIDIEQFDKSLRIAGITNYLVECSLCSETGDSKKTFVNDYCGHRFCSDCVNKKITSKRCPVLSCKKNINEESLLKYNESLIFEEGLIKKHFTCLSCQKNVEFSYHEKSKPHYWKCSYCSKTSCFDHEVVMSKCLCFCPRCLGYLSKDSINNFKQCSKCNINYCLNCGQENKRNQLCSCLKGHSSIGKSLLDELPQPKIPKNSCIQCNDFRDNPDFIGLGCGHLICEFCIFIQSGEINDIKNIKCTACIDLHI